VLQGYEFGRKSIWDREEKDGDADAVLKSRSNKKEAEEFIGKFAHAERAADKWPRRKKNFNRGLVEKKLEKKRISDDGRRSERSIKNITGLTSLTQEGGAGMLGKKENQRLNGNSKQKEAGKVSSPNLLFTSLRMFTTTNSRRRDYLKAVSLSFKRGGGGVEESREKE